MKTALFSRIRWRSSVLILSPLRASRAAQRTNQPYQQVPVVNDGGFCCGAWMHRDESTKLFDAKALQWGRRFTRKSKSVFDDLIQQIMLATKTVHSFMDGKARATYPQVACIPPDPGFMFRPAHFAYGRIELTDVE